MSLLHAFLFGLLQGLTEFLPISSSAHLKCARLLFGVEHAVIFDLVCHLGTLGAVLYFFKRDIYQLLTTERKKLRLLLLATLPLIPCYFLLKPLREAASAPQFLGLCLMGTGLILFLGQRWRVKRRASAVSDVLWIGALQASALIPGISRSASTISCAQVLGWEAKEAVRFSFLLSIPTILGGNCLELVKIAGSMEAVASVSLGACLVGFLTALGVGLGMVRCAIAFLEKGNFRPFAWYCFCMGMAMTLYFSR